jgi:hypothetical protein
MILTGKSADGSDAHEPLGVFVSPCGTYWSNKPITREQKAYEMIWNHCVRYRKSFRMLYEQVKNGSKENLPKWVRNYLIETFEEDENNCTTT